MIGNSRIVMISTISPSLFSVDETVNTLLFANRAKNVQTIVKKNIISNVNNNNNLKDKNEADMEYQINKYDEIISNLNNELENLRHNLAVKTHNQHLLRGGNDYSNNNVNSKIDKITREITTHFNDEIRMKNEIIDIQKNIDMLIEKYHEKEFLLFKCLNNNNNNITNEKIIRSSLNKINEQINLQKGLLINKENSYNELMKKREYFENVINKISNNNANNNNNNNFNNLQYLYHSFVFEVNNIENEFIRKQNLNQIRQKNMKIQKLVEQLIKILNLFLKMKMILKK